MKNNLFHMSDGNQLCPFLAVRDFDQHQSFHRFGTGKCTLSGRDLIAWDISLCVWICS